jgi:hypothetical protein
MIETHWKRIAGLYVMENGDSAAVWIAHDPLADVLHLYDCCLMVKEIPVVVAEALNTRGRWIPVAWEKHAKGFSGELLDRGCNMLPDAVDDADANAERVSREILERMRTGRFKADKRLKSWIDEYNTLYHDSTKIPRDSSPLMAATRMAVAMLDWAKRQSPKRGTASLNYPKLAIL